MFDTARAAVYGLHDPEQPYEEWQRVVMQDGAIAGGGFAQLQQAMLEAEGVGFLPDGRVDMMSFRWGG